MYLAHFDLSDHPFAITPDPRFVYLTQRHREALAHLLYGLGEGGGFVQLTGEVGTGKTTICRTLLHQLPDNVDVALIFNPQLTVTELLGAVCGELHIELPANELSAKALTDRLYAYLIDANTRGRRTVLIIDEAQNLSPELLEEVRLLTNLETDDCKLLQIFLIGQPELRTRLAGQELRQLAQRITARYHLGPLTREETRLYVHHRLSIAGARRELFTEPSLRLIHRLSAGIPRRINILCDRALLGGYASDADRIGTRIVRRAHSELEGRHGSHALPATRRVRPVLITAAVFAAALLALRHDGTREWANALLTLQASAPTVVAAARPEPQTSEPFMAPDAAPPSSPAVAQARGKAMTMREPAVPVAVEHIVPPSATATAVPHPSPPLSPPMHELVAELDSDIPAAPSPSPPLAELVTRLNGDGSQEATRALTLLWGEATPPEDGDLCAWAAQRGLACHAGPSGWPQLRKLDLPLILELEGRAGGTTYTVLRGLSTRTAIIELGGEVHRVSPDEVSRLWNGESIVLWRPRPESPGVLRPGQRGPEVSWLRKQLARLDGAGAPSQGGEHYDDALRARVMAFQRHNQLHVDGIVGPQTQIFLSRDLSAPSSPSLKVTPSGDTTPSPGPAVALGPP